VATPEKRTRRQNALIVFEDESGISLLPSARATWAARGQTPVLRHCFAWKQLSLAGALAYEPDGSDAHLVFKLRPGAYNDETPIEFLGESNELEQQRPVVLIWDGLPSSLISQPTDERVDHQPTPLALGRTPARLCARPQSDRSSRSGAAVSEKTLPLCAVTPSTKWSKSPKPACTVSAVTPHSASPSSVTLAFPSDLQPPAISRCS
jgi:hypothetical protein